MSTGDLETDRFRPGDISLFLELARQEGWLCDPWELEFQLKSFPQGCHVRREAGSPLGFVNSVKYESSGWVGNLLVDAESRGRGIGRALMNEAIAALENSGVRTVWLTASPSGAPLYRSLGFVGADTISRWHSKSRPGPEASAAADMNIMAVVDREGWGDGREKLIDLLAGRGELFCSGKAFLVRYRYGDGMVLGPWGGSAPEDAASLLENALLTPDGGEDLYIDVPDGNPHAASLLESAGFKRKGSTLLMFRGETPEYRPGLIYGLASMGSMG